MCVCVGGGWMHVHVCTQEEGNLTGGKQKPSPHCWEDYNLAGEKALPHKDPQQYVQNEFIAGLQTTGEISIHYTALIIAK